MSFVVSQPRGGSGRWRCSDGPHESRQSSHWRSAPVVQSSAEKRKRRMSKVTYEIIRHENGWAYRARGTISETFPTHDAALEAARSAAAEQRVPGETVGIQYETADGIWH